MYCHGMLRISFVAYSQASSANFRHLLLDLSIYEIYNLSLHQIAKDVTPKQLILQTRSEPVDQRHSGPPITSMGPIISHSAPGPQFQYAIRAHFGLLCGPIDVMLCSQTIRNRCCRPRVKETQVSRWR